MPFGILLIVGITALILGYMEFKFHPFVGIVTQIVSFLILLGIFINVLSYGGDFLEFFTANVFITYITIIALGLTLGNVVAEVT